MIVIDDNTMPDALKALAAADKDLARIQAAIGPPGLQAGGPGFPTLLNIIVTQQVSKASGEAIWGRLEDRCRPLEPKPFLALSDEDHRAIGFSRQKTAYSRGLAQALDSGDLDLDHLATLDDEAAITELTKLKGIGRWSAEIYLLFGLGRPDIWPADDLAVIIGVQRLKGLEHRPKRAEMEAIAEPWRPWRSVAARMMWQYYRHGEAEGEST